jgi:hypothetical protein
MRLRIAFKRGKLVVKGGVILVGVVDAKHWF